MNKAQIQKRIEAAERELEAAKAELAQGEFNPPKGALVECYDVAEQRIRISTGRGEAWHSVSNFFSGEGGVFWKNINPAPPETLPLIPWQPYYKGDPVPEGRGLMLSCTGEIFVGVFDAYDWRCQAIPFYYRTDNIKFEMNNE